MTKKYPSTIKASSVVGTAMGAAVFGALVGGTGAAAKGIREVKSGDATREEVALNVAREAGSTAVAAGTATAVVGALGFGPFLSILGIAAVATGTKYAMDSLLAPKQQGFAPVMIPAGKAAAATPVAAPQKKAAKKSTAKKPTTKKAAPKKPAAKKTAAPKTAKTATPKKTSPKKATARKPAAKKAETKTDTV